MIWLFAYLACVPLANWMLGNVGIATDGGLHVVPVGFGLVAPSGVLAIGASLCLRDVVHDRYGTKFAAAAILLGSVISALIADPFVAMASASAYAIGEGADLVVYAPLRQRGYVAVAVVLSGIVGAIVDSALFLYVAFGSLEYISGQIVGKVWITLAAGLYVWMKHRVIPQWRLFSSH